LPKDWVNWKPKKETGGKPLARELVEEALKLKAQGIPQREIAQRLNTSRTGLRVPLKFGRYIEREPKVDHSFVKTRVKLTQEIVDTFCQGSREDLNHSIPLALPLQYPHKDLLVDPYVFGYWLGDGCHTSGTFTCDPKDQDNLKHFITQAGYSLGNVSCYKTVSALGLITDIKAVGGYRKEIPTDYWYCSPEQRLSVLQGLMDSDGCVGKSSVEFTAKRKLHAEYVLWLARSLGQKPVMSEGRATLNGEDCGPKYRVTWRPAHKINPFRLERKAKKVNFGGSQESRNHHRMIVGFEEIDPKPMRCFTVDSPNSLFLIGDALIPTHNTRSGAEWVRHRVKMGDKRIACVAPTKGDIRRVMVEGESGLLNVCYKEDRTYRKAEMGYPEWSPTNSKLVWKNGAEAQFFSAEDPDRLRGPQFHSAWADEVSSWRNQQDVWDMLMFCLRLGRHPRAMVTTTPKPTKLMRSLLKHPKAIISTGSTFDNADNLAGTFLEAIKKTYEGTRLGEQELYAKILEEAEGALWTTEVLDQAYDERIEDPKEFAQTLNRVVVSVDPAITSNAESDMTGIVVAGVDVNGRGYVLEDATEKLSPQGWAAKAIRLYREYGADRIVAERNQGGDMVRRTLEAEDETVPIRLVHASRGKFARAEPISALYEQGKVKHAKNLDELETQMRTWEPLGSIGSPDRLDSCVWALTDLMLNGVAKPQMKLAYSSARGLQQERFM